MQMSLGREGSQLKGKWEGPLRRQKMVRASYREGGPLQGQFLIPCGKASPHPADPSMVSITLETLRQGEAM